MGVAARWKGGDGGVVCRLGQQCQRSENLGIKMNTSNERIRVFLLSTRKEEHNNNKNRNKNKKNEQEKGTEKEEEEEGEEEPEKEGI